MVHKPTTAPHTRHGDEYHLQNGKHPSPAYENPPSPEESSIPTTTLTTIFNGADGIKRHQANGILQHCITYKPQPNQPTTVFNMMESTQTVLTSSNFIASNPNGKPAEPRKRRVAQPRKRATKQPPITSIDTTPYASVLPMVPGPTVALSPSISSLPSIQHTLSIQPSQFPPLASPVPTIEQPRIDLKADVETDISDDEAMPSTRPSEQRILERKWEKTRCSIAWRWTWLQLQVHELEFQMNKCDEVLQKKKRSKQKVVPLFDSDDKHHSLRTSGLSKPTKNRKLFRVPSSKSKSSSSLDRAAESHPLFSIHQVPKRPPKRKREDPIKLEKTIQKQVKKTTPAEPPSLRSSSNKNKSRKKARATSRSQLLPQQQQQLPQQTVQQQPINPKKKKKYLRTSDFDIDNYVMPYGMAVATPVIPEFDDSEIQTPTWRIIEDLLGSSSEAESDGEEDTSDEKFALRHFPNELLERKRYLEPLTQKKRRGGNMPRIPSRGNLSSDFPDEFLVSPLETKDKDELDKLEEKKLKLIRETYLNHTQFKPIRWEEIAPSDYFDHRRFFWEVIQNQATNEGKNVIYVRRTPKSLEEMQKEEGVEDESDAAEWFGDENGGGTDEDETDVEFLMGEEVGVEEEETDDGEYAKKKRVRKR